MLLLWLAVCFFSVPAVADDWSALKQRLQADGFDSATVEGLYRHPELRFDPEPMAVKITTLMQRPTRQQRRQIVMTYNNSQIYANTVLAVADRLRTIERKRN